MNEYKFYIQKVDSNENPSGTAVDLEASFPGLRYKSCEGLETYGKIKNIETESYAESEATRVWHPSDGGLVVECESTTLTLNLVFLGEERRASLALFRELAYSGRLFYWDTARLKKVCLLLKDEQTVEADTLSGLQYISAAFKFTNIWGRSRSCLADGTISGLLAIYLDEINGDLVAVASGDGAELERLKLNQITGEIEFK